MIVPRCSRCGRPCDTYLCPKCIKAKQAYVDEVNELLAHGVPLGYEPGQFIEGFGVVVGDFP